MINVLMLKNYITQVNSVIFLPHLLLSFNGIASTYYHSTLNLFGKIFIKFVLEKYKFRSINRRIKYFMAYKHLLCSLFTNYAILSCSIQTSYVFHF